MFLTEYKDAIPSPSEVGGSWQAFMTQMNFEPQQETESRYQPALLQQVTTLASRLQDEHRETLTAQQMEAIGAEVGLEPAFVRKALDQLTQQKVLKKTTQTAAQTTTTTASKAEFYTAIVALAFPFFWGTLAYFMVRAGLSPRFFSPRGGLAPTEESTSLAIFFSLLAPGPLAVLQGFLTGKKSLGRISGLVLACALAATFPYAVPTGYGIDGATALPYAFVGAGMLSLLGNAGARLRERYFPLPSAEKKEVGNLSRAELLDALFALQQQLQGQKQHRAFLSVDVVGSTEMKHGASDLAVEHAFGQLRRWIEQIVAANGGQIQSTAGDGMMCLFPNDAAAIRAARALQERLPQFNSTISNALMPPFRLRCGVNAGDVAIEDGAPIGHLNSVVIDRAAQLQKRAEPEGILISGDMAVAAFAELGQAQLTPETILGEVVFIWRKMV